MNVYAYIFTMALVTYLIRMLPLALFRKEITSPFVKSFLYYVPYACLSAMTFPAILSSTASLYSGIAGFAVALLAAYRERSLVVVALEACAAVFVAERILEFFF
ncbi:MAG: AzlD domain-containing protein [Blautia sp.]|nr:AzlD domain-containing protein [Blautia sp.]